MNQNKEETAEKIKRMLDEAYGKKTTERILTTHSVHNIKKIEIDEPRSQKDDDAWIWITLIFFAFALPLIYAKAWIARPIGSEYEYTLDINKTLNFSEILELTYNGYTNKIQFRGDERYSQDPYRYVITIKYKGRENHYSVLNKKEKRIRLPSDSDLCADYIIKLGKFDKDKINIKIQVSKIV